MATERHAHESTDKKKSSAPTSQPAVEGEYFSPVDTSHKHILYLQRTVGNQAVQRLVAQRRVPVVQREETPAQEVEEPAPIEPVQEIAGDAPADGPDEIDHGRVIRLEGLTTASFSQSSNTFVSEGTNLARAEGCDGCGDRDPCVRVTTTIVSTFSVPISVRLPNLDAMDLTECERQQCQNWIDTVLEPHEQQHVAAFQAYNGTTRHPLSFTCCNSQAQSELDSRARTIMETERDRRKAAVIAASNALDPFNMDFEVNCPEEEESAAEDAPAESAEPVE